MAERKEGANQSWPLNLTIEFPYPLIFKRTVWQTCVLRFIFKHTWTNKQSVNSFKQNELAHLPSLRCKGDCEIFSGRGGGSTWANLFNWSWIGLQMLCIEISIWNSILINTTVFSHDTQTFLLSIYWSCLLL